MAQQENGPVKDRAIPVAPVKNKGDGKEEIANSGHQTARPQEALNVRSNARIKVEGREKETSDIGRQVRQKRQPTPNSEVSNRTGASLSGKEGRPLCSQLQER